jgi:hypothetical protein
MAQMQHAMIGSFNCGSARAVAVFADSRGLAAPVTTKERFMKLVSAVTVAAALIAAASAQGQIRITEWTYQGASGEWIEFTNVGNTAVDFSGWSFDDDSRVAGTVNLSAFGLVAAGESVILADITAAAFRTAWNLGAGVKVIGGNTTNLGRGDEINIFNGSTLVDRLTYDDVLIGGVRTQNVTANIALANLGLNQSALAPKSVVGDAYGSYKAATSNDVGNPGLYLPIPAPGSLALVGMGLLVAGSRRR